MCLDSRRAGHHDCMRTGLAVLVLLAVAAPASADSKVASLVKFYKREATVCAKWATGIASAKERAEPYVDDAEIAADVKSLGEEHAAVTSFCEAVDATLAILDPKASYKSQKDEIEKHDAIVREARTAARQALDESDVVIQRLIPKVNKRRASS